MIFIIINEFMESINEFMEIIWDFCTIKRFKKKLTINVYTSFETLVKFSVDDEGVFSENVGK